MDDFDLSRFLTKYIKIGGEMSSEEMAVFGRLVRLTLKYRDRLKAEKGIILTVGKTKKAIDYYEKALKENRMPEIRDKIIAGLVRLWLKEINKKAF